MRIKVLLAARKLRRAARMERRRPRRLFWAPEMPRPKLPEKQKRTAKFQVPFTRAELARVKEAARAAHEDSTAQWIRRIVLSEADRLLICSPAPKAAGRVARPRARRDA